MESGKTMAINLNSVTIAGNIAREIEVRYTAGGMAGA